MSSLLLVKSLKMKHILKHLLITAFCFLPIFAYAQDGKVRLTRDSKLSIKGKSNVNDFRCKSEHALHQDSLDYYYRVTGDTVQVDGVSLSLEVSQFDCGKKGINRDFRSTLKYEEHPFIKIILNELIIKEETGIIPREAKVTIIIAGIKRDYIVPLTYFSSSEERFIAGGHKTLAMSDFGLTPPSPLFGLIQVSNELDIEFDLVITRAL